jgi:TRAP-type C4-dicarboxylate transport system permease small subunit
MVYYGWKMAALQVTTHQHTIIMKIPLVYLYALMPAMGIMMFIRIIQVSYQDIQKLRSKPDETT